MPEECSIKGRWWVSGQEKEPVAGILTCTSEYLKLSGWVPRGLNSLSALEPDEQAGLRKVPSLIRGEDSNGDPVTLFGCCLGTEGVAAALTQWEIDALAAVQGLKIGSWTDPVVRAVVVRTEFLHRWIGRRLFKVENTPGGENACSMRPPPCL